MNDKIRHIADESELIEALDRWGCDLDSWPEPAATDAERLLIGSPEARNLVQEAADLQTRLGELGEHRAPSGLAARILAELPPRDGLQRIVDWLTGALWRPALAAAIPLVLGFVLGVAVPEEDSPLADELSLLAFSAAYEDLEDDE